MASLWAKHYLLQLCRFLITTPVVCYLIGISDAQSVTAMFQNNPIDEGSTAILICKLFNLGSNYASIERTIFSRTERLVLGSQVLPDVDDNIRVSVSDNADGSKNYVLSIRGVLHEYDAGTYTCKILTPSQTVITMRSVHLNINYDPYYPRCSIVQTSSELIRVSGSEVRLGCHSDLGYPVVNIAWSYSGCNNDRFLPQPSVTNSGAYYAELRVTLTGEDNGGVFMCTISRSDGSFSRSCPIGPWQVTGGRECNVNTMRQTTPSVSSQSMNGTDTGSSSSKTRNVNKLLGVVCLIASLFSSLLPRFWK